MIQTFDIYISGRNSVSSLYSSSNNRRKHNFQYTRTTNLPYQLSSLFKKKKNLRLNRPYIFHSFPPIIPFYRGLNGKPIVSVRGARREGEKKREREKKGGGDVSKRRVKRCTFKLFALVRKD